MLIFSGIIRNFFIRYKGEICDLDLVLSCVDNFNIDSFFFDYIFRKNSFGGYKVKINNLLIDIWELVLIWVLNNVKVELEFFNDYNLLNIVFFNFFVVVFNYNIKKFIVSDSFMKFLEIKEIDLVFEENFLL